MGRAKKKVAKRRSTRRPINTTELVSVGIPLGPTLKELREWSAAEFLRWKREAHQATSQLVQVIPAVSGAIPGAVERRPLPPPKPHRGGRPNKPSLSDEAVRSVTGLTTREAAEQLGVHRRTIERHRKRIESLSR